MLTEFLKLNCSLTPARHTLGLPIFGPQNPGVPVRAVQAQLSVLWTTANSSAIGWFPGSLARDLRSAIIDVSMSLNRWPPAGVSRGGNIERSEFGDFRVDVENLRGHNLRVF